MDTGTRLKLVRERNNLSQRELARRSGLTNSTISQIEQNRVSPSVSSLKKLLDLRDGRVGQAAATSQLPLGEVVAFTHQFESCPRVHSRLF